MHSISYSKASQLCMNYKLKKRNKIHRVNWGKTFPLFEGLFCSVPSEKQAKASTRTPITPAAKESDAVGKTCSRVWHLGPLTAIQSPICS